MIVLRKLGGTGVTSVIVADPLSGVQNGINQVFTTTSEYVQDRITVYYNGQALHSPDDFTQSGPKEITFKHIFPIETAELRATYEVNELNLVGIDHGGLDGLLDDDHPQYLTPARGDARYYTQAQVDTISGTLYDAIINHHDTFTGLLDTPATYSGSEGKYLRVREDGNGIEFSEIKDEFNGKQAINMGATSVFVAFSTAVNSADYTVTVSLENQIDSEPSIYSTLVTQVTTSGFTVLFSGDMDTPNYKLNWIAKL